VLFRSGRKPNSPLDACFSEHIDNALTKAVSVEKVIEYVNNLSESMDKMHKKVANLNKANRDRKRNKINEHCKHYKFGLGDFVLVAIPKKKIRSKLQVVWSGPQKITEVMSDWVFKVQDLKTEKFQVVHANRLRFYSETMPENFIDLSNKLDEKLFDIDELLNIRSGRTGWEIQVSWLGFTDLDRTWEPIQNIYEDIPLILHNFLLDKGREDIWKDLRKSDNQSVKKNT